MNANGSRRPVDEGVPTGMDETQPSGGPVPNRHHVHNSYIWLGSLRAVGVLLVVLAASLASSIASLIEESVEFGQEIMGDMPVVAMIIGAVALGFILIIAVIVGIHAWAWRHLYYELGPEEFSLYSGIITKKRVHVPYQRIQSVDQKASLLQRIFGVCNLSIDTAGGAANKAILVQYLRKSTADNLRRELFARKQIAIAGPDVLRNMQSAPNGAPVYTNDVPADAVIRGATAAEQAADGFVTGGQASSGSVSADGNILDVGEQVWQDLGGIFAGQAAELETASYEYSLSNKELFFTGLSNNSGFAVALIVVIAAIGQIAGAVFDLFPSAGDTLTDTVVSTSGLIGIEAVIGITIVAVIGIALIVWIISIISACIQYGGFHARRRGNRIEVERGLLQHQTQSVSIDRIQAVIVKQTFIRKLIGYCELSLGKVDAKSDGDDSNKNSLAQDGIIVHPFLKLDRVNEIVSGLVPEFADMPEEETHLAKAALRRGMIRRCIWQGGGFWLAVIAGICVAVLEFIVASDSEFMADPESAAIVFGIEMTCYVLIGLGILLIVIAAIGTVMWARNSSFAVNRRFMRIKNGGLSTESMTFPKSKIQFGYTKQNPLQRMAKTATVNARTAAGVGGTTISLIDVSLSDAESYLDWMKPARSQ